jgi:hypothetical protein
MSATFKVGCSESFVGVPTSSKEVFFCTMDLLLKGFDTIAHTIYRQYPTITTPAECKAKAESITEGFKTDPLFQQFFLTVALGVWCKLQIEKSEDPDVCDL